MNNAQVVNNCDNGRHEFDLMRSSNSSRISVMCPTKNAMKTAWELADQQIPGQIASISAVEQVISYNPNNVLLICREDKVVGIWAMLMLSAIGLEELLLGELNVINPNMRSIAPRGVAPSGIYFWAAVAPGIAVGGVMQVSNFLRDPLYNRANCFSRPNTPAGKRFNINMGFKAISCGTPNLYRYVRLANQTNSSTPNNIQTKE